MFRKTKVKNNSMQRSLLGNSEVGSLAEFLDNSERDRREQIADDLPPAGDFQAMYGDKEEKSSVIGWFSKLFTCCCSSSRKDTSLDDSFNNAPRL